MKLFAFDIISPVATTVDVTAGRQLHPVPLPDMTVPWYLESAIVVVVECVGTAGLVEH